MDVVTDSMISMKLKQIRNSGLDQKISAKKFTALVLEIEVYGHIDTNNWIPFQRCTRVHMSDKASLRLRGLERRQAR